METIVEPTRYDSPMDEAQRKAFLRATFARMAADPPYDTESAIDDITDRWFGDVIAQRYLVATRAHNMEV